MRAAFRGRRRHQKRLPEPLAESAPVEPGLAYYIKGRATPLPPMVKYPRLVRFEVAIEEILEDQAEEDEAGARITGGITFEPGPDQSDLLKGWEEMIAALRS